MTEDPMNNQYGLNPKEARMIGLSSDQGEGVNKDVEMENAITRHIRSMGVDHVHVRVANAKVFLSGMCFDFAEKRAVVTTVGSMPGVHKVVNQIKVVPGDTGRPGRAF